MSSTANTVAAKLTKITNARKQNKERRKQLELEAERERLEEVQLAKELEEMRAEEKWKAEEVRETERQAEEQRKAKVTRAFAQKEAELLRKQLEEAKKKKELKRSRLESEMEVEAELEKEEEKTGESAMMDRDMVWRTKARKICGEFWKGGRKCFWSRCRREPRPATSAVPRKPSPSWQGRSRRRPGH